MRSSKSAEPCKPLEGWSQTTRLILIIAAITAAIVIISRVI